jgi:pimeloyl-ACP methyl ester carboxylesterase
MTSWEGTDGVDWATFMVLGTNKKLGKIVAFVLVALVMIIGFGWVFAVPPELKTIIAFSRWHDAHVRASGYVERQPAGTRVYWEEFGTPDGPPVVVLPAGLCTIAVMGGQIEPLAVESYRVIAIDARGVGPSSNTAPGLTYETMSDDVAGVMDALKITRADIVGWSDGGNLGLDLARRHPDRVRKVVAFGANHTPAPDGEDPAMVKEFKEAKPDGAMFWPIRRMYEKSSPTPEKWPVLFEQERTMAFTQPNWSLEQLGFIHAPVLLINGEHDLVLRSYAIEMKNAIPGARLEIIPGGTHEVPLAQPDAVNRILLRFLKQ